MKPTLSLNKLDKVLLFFSSIYLIVTSLISIWFIFIIIYQVQELAFTIILVLIASFFIIGLTLWTNSVILSKPWTLGKREININLVICLIQSISFFLDGFRFKYLQGLEYIFFIYFDQTRDKFGPGIISLRPGFEFVFNFMSTNEMHVGFNIIALIFSGFFIYIKRKYLSMKANQVLNKQFWQTLKNNPNNDGNI